MVDEINTVPNKKINERRENIAAYFLGNGPFGLFLVFKPCKHAQIGFPYTHCRCKYNWNQDKSHQLVIDVAVHQLQPFDGHPHEMWHQQANGDIYTQATDELGIKKLVGKGEENIDACKHQPAQELEKPVFWYVPEVKIHAFQSYTIEQEGKNGFLQEAFQAGWLVKNNKDGP